MLYLRQHAEVKLPVQFPFDFPGVIFPSALLAVKFMILFQSLLRLPCFFIYNAVKDSLLHLPLGIFLTAQVTFIVLRPYAQAPQKRFPQRPARAPLPLHDKLGGLFTAQPFRELAHCNIPLLPQHADITHKLYSFVPVQLHFLSVSFPVAHNVQAFSCGHIVP